MIKWMATVMHVIVSVLWDLISNLGKARDRRFMSVCSLKMAVLLVVTAEAL